MEPSEPFKKQYMVEFDVPSLTTELLEMIPEQRIQINKLFIEGRLLSYSLSMDRSKVFAIFLAIDDEQLIESIESLPLTVYMEYTSMELMFHNTIHLIPTMSLN